MYDHDEYPSSVARRLRHADRFDNYREISARFDSTGKCGHPVKKGDRVGYNKLHGIRCSACWRKWAAENAAADADERMYASGY